MAFSTLKTKSQSGNALAGIVVIVLVLILAGIYFYRMVQKQTIENRMSQERAAAEQSSSPPQSANVIESIP